MHNRPRVLDVLLSLTKDRDIAVDHPSCTGPTALHIAAATGNSHFVKRLIGAGADPNITDLTRATPLHELMRTRFNARTNKISQTHQEAARVLIQAGAFVDSCDYSELTPLDLAEESRAVAMLASGAPVRDADGTLKRVDDEIILLMRERHSSSRAHMEVIKARWSALTACCTCGK